MMSFEEILSEINQRGISDPDFFGGGTKGSYEILQNPNEFSRFIQWCQETFPDGIPSYLEIGTATGGNIRTVYELVGFNRALSIDLDAEGLPKSRARNLAAIPKEKHKLWEGNSHTMSAHLALRDFNQQFDLAFIDGDHFGPGVQMDIELAYGFMKEDSYMVFHDICNPYWPGIYAAIKWAKENILLREYINISDNSCHFGIGICRVMK